MSKFLVVEITLNWKLRIRIKPQGKFHSTKLLVKLYSFEEIYQNKQEFLKMSRVRLSELL